MLLFYRKSPKLKIILFAGFFFLLFQSLWAQLTVNSSKPLTNERLEFIYDAGKGNKALFGLHEDLYFHAGLITENSRDEKDWKFVVGEWGKDDEKVKMTALGGDKYRFELVVNNFFDFPEETVIQQLAFVFRNKKGDLVGKTEAETDLLVAVNGYRNPTKSKANFRFTKREYLSHKMSNGQLQVYTDYGSYLFTPFSDEILHLEYLPDNKRVDYQSVSVVLKPEEVEISLVDACEEITFIAGEIQVNIQKSPLEISYQYRSDFLFGEELGFFERSDNNGIRLKLGEGEHIYGAGERAVPMDRRGYRLELYNRPDYNYGLNAQNLNYVLPLILSSNRYLVLFDNPQKGYFDIGNAEKDILEFGALGGQMNYYLVVGNRFEDINTNYCKLTGFQPLPPRWALGNLQSRMAYRTQSELEGIVDEMQKKDFPLDAVIIDFYWFGDSIKGGLGNLKWYKKNWPEPEKMIAGFKEKGVKTILITEPMVIDTAYWFTHGDTSNLFAKNSEGKTYIMKDFYFGPGALMDIFKQETKDWFWQQYENQIKIGVAGWWGDLGEPETHPSDMIHVNGTADEVHNIYGHEWEKMLFEKYREFYPNRRLFHLNRAGAAGSQRYSIFPWSGDVSRSWSGLQAQLPLMLNMSISGLGYISSDLGGFAMGEKDEELYRRWLQFGTFNPIFRPHGSGIPSEPIFFNQETQNIVRETIKLRYRLMPYIYTLAYENTVSGKPLVKPLFYLETENEKLLNYSDAYLFGDAFLVAPIVQSGVKEKKLIFPKGEWYNFFTDELIVGGKEVLVAVEKENIPVFVKAGSIVCTTTDFNSTDYYPQDLTVHYYLAANTQSSTKLFEDDGADFNSISDEKYQLTRIAASDNRYLLHVIFEKEADHFPRENRVLKLIVHGWNSKPEKVLLNGRLLKAKNKKGGDYFWDKQTKKLVVDSQWKNQDLDLRIEK
jgi:oligosaccharide 4-alpha-D-glucosyltransferase